MRCIKVMRCFKGKQYDTEIISIGENQVGFVYGWRPTASSGFRLMPEACSRENLGHASCILPKGQLVGFGFDRAEVLLNSSYLQEKLEIGLPGQIAYNGEMGKRYTDCELAIKFNIHSSVLIIDALPYQVTKFKNFWKNDPGTFTKVSRNCSTFSYKAFRSADLVSFTLTPIMTPKILYGLILDTCKSRNIKCIEKTGFLGIEFISNDNNNLIIMNETKK